MSDDDDGEWAERAERRKRVAATAAAEAAVNKSESQDGGAGEDSQLPSARDMGIAGSMGSEDLKAMLDAGRTRRRERVPRGTDAAAAAMQGGKSHGSGGGGSGGGGGGGGGSGSFGSFGGPAATAFTGGGSGSTVATGGSRLAPGAVRPLLERHASTSFMGRGGGSRSNHAGGPGAGAGGRGGGGLSRAMSGVGGGASRGSFFVHNGEDSQSMWDRDAAENGTAPTVGTDG